MDKVDDIRGMDSNGTTVAVGPGRRGPRAHGGKAPEGLGLSERPSGQKGDRASPDNPFAGLTDSWPLAGTGDAGSSGDTPPKGSAADSSQRRASTAPTPPSGGE